MEHLGPRYTPHNVDSDFLHRNTDGECGGLHKGHRRAHRYAHASSLNAHENEFIVGLLYFEPNMKMCVFTERGQVGIIWAPGVRDSLREVLMWLLDDHCDRWHLRWSCSA